MIIHDTNTKILLHIVLFVIILYFSAKHQKSVTAIGCAMYGSQIVTLGIDSYTNRGLTGIAYQWTVLRYATGSQSAVPRCEWTCKALTFSWMTLFVLGATTQLLLRQLDITSKKKDKLVLGQDKQFVNTYNYDAYSTNKQRLVPKVEGAAQRAAYNYYDLKKLPVELTGLYSVLSSLVQQLAGQYGFQYDNVQNQMEHVLFLYGNLASRSLNDGVTKLHNKIFSNYREWCEYLQVEAQLCASKADKTTSELKLAELVLWLLIWGESSTLRHTPELLCYLFHNCSIELRQLHDNKPAPRRQAGDFLQHVVTPLYNIMRDERGSIETKRNYDDINEFFWSRDCLNTYYANQQYDVSNANGRDDGESGTSIYAGLPTVHDVLLSTKKTYLERRSWLHPFRSFYRLVVFYAVAFHVLVCLSLQTYKNVSWWTADSNRVLSSFVITLSGTSLLKELLDVWATYGIMGDKLSVTVGFIVRLTVKSMFFMYLTLFYVWSVERSDMYYSYYMVIAAIYVVPTIIHVLANLFPSISTLSRSQKLPFIRRMLQLWYPLNSLYVGRSVHEREGLTYKYQLFWLSLLSLKLYLSYHFQVAPLIAPSVRILYIAGEVPVIRRWQSIADTLVLFVLWVPFILVYMFDTGIWFSVWQAGAGVVVGMMDRIGEIRSFTALVSVFLSLPQQFDAKFMGNKKHASHTQSSTVTPGSRDYPAAERASSSTRNTSASDHILNTVFSSYHTGSNGYYTAPAPETAQEKREKFDRFGVAWNAIVEDLRQGDLVSNAEKQLLVFRQNEYTSKTGSTFNVPLFLTAGRIEQMIELSAELSQRQQSKTVHTADLNAELIEFCNQPLHNEALKEFWQQTTYLLTQLLGDRHKPQLTTLIENYSKIATGGYVINALNIHQMSKVKKSLLDLIRSLRIAAASFTSVQLHEIDDDQSDES